MALDGVATFPAQIWDGDSGNRDSDAGDARAPDHRDWARMLAEMQAVQKSNNGYDPATINSYGTIGTASGLSVVERGNAALHKTTITLTDAVITMTDGTTPATDAMWGTLPLYTFPQGHLLLHGSHVVYPLGKVTAGTGGGAGLSDTADLEMGVGTTARANASNFALAAAEKNLVDELVLAQLVGGTTAAIESIAAAAAVFFDGSASAAVANLNFITSDDADAGTSPDTLIVSGTVTLLWSIQGDD